MSSSIFPRFEMNLKNNGYLTLRKYMICIKKLIRNKILHYVKEEKAR